MLKHWMRDDDWHPLRCSFTGGDDGDSSSDGGPSADTSDLGPTGDMFGDNVSNADFFGPAQSDLGTPGPADVAGPGVSGMDLSSDNGGPFGSMQGTGGPADPGEFTGNTQAGPDFSNAAGPVGPDSFTGWTGGGIFGSNIGDLTNAGPFSLSDIANAVGNAGPGQAYGFGYGDPGTQGMGMTAVGLNEGGMMNGAGPFGTGQGQQGAGAGAPFSNQGLAEQLGINDIGKGINIDPSQLDPNDPSNVAPGTRGGLLDMLIGTANANPLSNINAPTQSTWGPDFNQTFSNFNNPTQLGPNTQYTTTNPNVQDLPAVNVQAPNVMTQSDLENVAGRATPNQMVNAEFNTLSQIASPFTTPQAQQVGDALTLSSQYGMNPDAFEAQARGEQGRGPATPNEQVDARFQSEFDPGSLRGWTANPEITPQIEQAGREMLQDEMTKAGYQPGVLTPAEQVGSRFGEWPAEPTPNEQVGSRFGDWPAPQQTPQDEPITQVHANPLDNPDITPTARGPANPNINDPNAPLTIAERGPANPNINDPNNLQTVVQTLQHANPDIDELIGGKAAPAPAPGRSTTLAPPAPAPAPGRSTQAPSGRGQTFSSGPFSASRGGIQSQMDALLQASRSAPTQQGRTSALDQLNGLISQYGNPYAGRGITDPDINVRGGGPVTGTGIFRGLAGGGTVGDDETVVVGEHGPELFTPGQGGTVTPLMETGAGTWPQQQPSLLDMIQGNAPMPQSFGLGPPYRASPQAFSGNAMSAPSFMGAGGDVFGAGAAPAGSLDFSSGAQAPSNWQNFQGNSSTGGGFFTIDDLYKNAPPVPSEWRGLTGGEMQGSPQNNMVQQQMPQAFHAGMDMPSTNNYRLLPPPFNSPQYVMRNGQIIDMLNQGAPGGRPLHGGGDYPASYVAGNWASFPVFAGWPGQLSPWSMTGTPTT